MPRENSNGDPKREIETEEERDFALVRSKIRRTPPHLKGLSARLRATLENDPDSDEKEITGAG